MATEIHGTCHPEFSAIEEAFTRNFEQGLEVGAGVAVTRGDEFVVDLWAGHADEEKTRPFENNSLTFVASSTKIITTLCALMLVDQGKIDPEKPVVEYWPEFGRHGKDKVLVKHIFAHTAGVPGWKPKVPWMSMTTWAGAVEVMESQELWFEPGEQICYHAESFGFLAGELVRRASGLTPGKFLSEHIAANLETDDIFLGIPEERLSEIFPRVAALVRNDTPPADISRVPEVFDCYEEPVWTMPEALTAEYPGANCVTSAHALAIIGGIFANHGEWNGHRFLSEPTLEFAMQEQSYGEDIAVLDERIRRGFGLGLNSVEFQCPSDQTVHWGGQGGSLMMADLASKTAIAYVPNNWVFEGFHEDPRNVALLDAYRAVCS